MDIIPLASSGFSPLLSRDLLPQGTWEVETEIWKDSDPLRPAPKLEWQAVLCALAYVSRPAPRSEPLQGHRRQAVGSLHADPGPSWSAGWEDDEPGLLLRAGLVPARVCGQRLATVSSRICVLS